MSDTSSVGLCAAPRTSCGSATGWRAGGRCPKCRHAHNEETNRYRGLSSDQREEALALLRAGRTPQEAASAIGKTPASLSTAAIQDAELRAALDGLPPERQFVARYGQYLAALAYCGGNRAAAARYAGMDPVAVKRHVHSAPVFAEAERAVIAWIESAGSRARTKVSEAQLGKAAAALEEGSTIAAAARQVGVSPVTLRNHAPYHPRLKAAMPPPTPGPGRKTSLTPELEARLRELWPDTSLSIAEIARRLEIPKSNAQLWAKRLGLPGRTRTPKPRKPAP